MKKIFLLSVCLVSFAMGGCSVFSSEKMVVTPYDSNTLWNLKVGRDYVAQGRYELAKEHYLIALASCNNEESRSVVTHELEAVDLMIKSQR